MSTRLTPERILKSTLGLTLLAGLAGCQPAVPEATSTPVPASPTAEAATPTLEPTGPATAAASTTPAPSATPEPGATGGPDEPKRIEFPPGGDSAVVEGMVQFPERDNYVLRALEGQTMEIEVTSADGSVNFSLAGLTDGQPYKRLENSDTHWLGVVSLTQDFAIQVATTSETPVAYSLDIFIAPLPPPLAPTPIVFDPGATSDTVSGALAAGGDVVAYSFQAAAGQALTVEISSDTPGAFTVLLKDAAGELLRWAVEPDLIEYALPADGEYSLLVSSFGAAPAINYTLEITIE
ncbi:MAG: hypothetical protein ACRDHL_02815 [Candidatus Promineifilaceae bacterium]